MRKIILFELNEVPFRVVDWYCEKHPQSNLATLLQRASQYRTYSEDRGHLSPWITWPTVHRGVTNEKHGIQHLGQIIDEAEKAYPPVWALLKRSGVSTGVGGSLHSAFIPEDYREYAFFLPDTFAATSEAHPDVLARFQALNIRMVAQSGRNVSTSIPWRDVMSLMKDRSSLGFRASTLVDVASHLVHERFNAQRKNRRRVYQSVLAFDLFMNQVEVTQPDFSTFFTNHVASAMHRFWAATFPGDYKKFELSKDWVDMYSGEIEFAMDKTDAFLGRLMNFVQRRQDYGLVVAGSMGQAATSARHRPRYLTIVNLDRFMAAMGFGCEEWSRQPAMAPEFSIRIAPERIDEFERRVAALGIDPKKLQHETQSNGFIHIYLADEEYAGPTTFAIDGRNMGFDQVGLGYLEDEEGVGTTGYHIPEGILLAYNAGRDNRPKRERPEISTKDIAPHLLSHYGAAIPDYMARPGQPHLFD